MTAKARCIVFLDIDGVLNSDRYVAASLRPMANELWTVDDLDPEAIRILNQVVARTEAKFVLSSSWRHHHSLEEMRDLLQSRGFEGELIDVTPRLFGDTRGAEIRTWLRVNGTVDVFAVVDDDAATERLEQSWIRTDPAVGLTETDIERLIQLLGVEFQAG